MNTARAALASMAGTAIEYYDFVIYGIAAALVFGRQFFPHTSSASATMAGLATYAVAFFARPIGGVLFGYLGDRIGRKSNLVITVTIIGAGTFLIGVLPTYPAIGFVAPIMLVVLRFLHGIALGGEWGGATLMAVEHAPGHRKGFFGAFVPLGSAVGSVLASAVFWVISLGGHGIGESNIWRIPFLLSALLTAVALYIRLAVPESPEFTKAARAKDISENPVRELLTRHRIPFALCIGALLVGYGGFQIVSIYLVLVYSATVGFPASTALAAGIVLNIASILTLPLYGWLGDRFGAARMSMIGCGYAIVTAFPMFAMVASRSTVLFLLAVPVCYAGANIAFALSSVLVARQFPARVRNTAVACCSTLAMLLGGALAPLLATRLVAAAHGGYWPVPIFLIVESAISLGCVAALARRSRVRTRDPEPVAIR